MFFIIRGAPDPDPDPAGYPVDFVDPVWIPIRPDPKSLDPDPAGSWFCTENVSNNDTEHKEDAWLSTFNNRYECERKFNHIELKMRL